MFLLGRKETEISVHHFKSFLLLLFSSFFEIPLHKQLKSQPRISGEFIYRLEGSSSFSSISTSSGSLELYLLTPQASKTVASYLNFSHLTQYRLGVPQREKRYTVIYSNMFPIFEGQILQSCLIYSSRLTVFYERISLIPTYFILLCDALLHFTDTVVFINWRSVAILHQASLLVPFFQEHLLFLCLCHILVILLIFQTFPVLLYLLWWSVIFYITTVILLGCLILCPYKTANLTDKCYACSECSTNHPFSHVSPYSLVLPVLWDTIL